MVYVYPKWQQQFLLHTFTPPTPPPEFTLKQTSDLNTYSAITNIREIIPFAILMFGVGVFALLGCDNVAFADYDGTEHPRNHTHTVSFDRHTDVRLESESPYGLRHHEYYNVVVDPPFHRNQLVYVKIIDQSATHGYDFRLYLPTLFGSTDNMKVLTLPAGKGNVPFAVSIRNDLTGVYAEEVFSLELYAAKHATYTVGTPSEMEVATLAGFSQSFLDEVADPKRGIHIQPQRSTIMVGDTSNYTVSLTSAPQADVTVRVWLDINGHSHDIGARYAEGVIGLRVMPATITFNQTNWNTPQTFTILTSGAGVDRYILIHGATSDDRDYHSSYYFLGSTVIGKTHKVVTVVSGQNAPPPEQELGGFSFPTSMTLSLSPASVHEGNGTTTITATLDAPAPPDGIDISLYASDGNATDGVDYTLPNVVTIIPGEQSGSASIAITDDSLDESNENAVISAYVEVFGQSMTDHTTLTIIDDDTSGVTITTDTTPLSVDEGDTTTYTIHLDSLPTANVTIHATSSDDGAVSVSPESYTFTPSNWDTSKTFTVAGVSDPDTNYELTHIRHTISSNDTRYTAILLPFVEVRVSDTTQEQGQKEEQEVQEEQEQVPPPETESEPELETKQPEQPQLDPIVAQYDTNNSGAIEQDEWVKAKEDYANGKLTNAEIHAISKARA